MHFALAKPCGSEGGHLWGEVWSSPKVLQKVLRKVLPTCVISGALQPGPGGELGTREARRWAWELGHLGMGLGVWKPGHGLGTSKAWTWAWECRRLHLELGVLRLEPGVEIVCET